MEQFVDRGKDKHYIIVAISALVLNLKIGLPVVAPRNVKLAHLLSREGICASLNSISDFVNFECHLLAKEIGI